MDYTKYYKQAIKMMDLIIKRDDFKEWIKDGKNLPDDFIPYGERQEVRNSCSVTTSKDFTELYQDHCNVLMRYLMEVVKFQKLLWVCQNNFELTMEDYLKRRDEITNPDMQKVIDGYKNWKESK